MSQKCPMWGVKSGAAWSWFPIGYDWCHVMSTRVHIALISLVLDVTCQQMCRNPIGCDWSRRQQTPAIDWTTAFGAHHWLRPSRSTFTPQSPLKPFVWLNMLAFSCLMAVRVKVLCDILEGIDISSRRAKYDAVDYRLRCLITDGNLWRVIVTSSQLHVRRS